MVLEIYREIFQHYKNHTDEAQSVIRVGQSEPPAEVDAPTLAAWTLVANQLMNLDEVLNK